MSSLKDFYNNPEVEEEEDSEDDEDFVPDENESDDQDLAEDDDDDEDEENKKRQVKGNDKGKKRELSEPEEDESTKKSRIDAIWADINQPKALPALKPEVAAPASATTTSTTTVIDKKETKKPISPLQQKRPKSQLSSLVSKYNIKEPKMNTLEKSKLDWQGYVDREGIRDDLKYKNKDGYMEKVAFLQRVDDRRLNQLKQGQKKK
ncbi:bucentaur or craniofacial development-domain-containing protein [Parasitella parasitica]|nr:bucentaur or craniofacial development-domain-containing protein [Parasitella parasitica]